MRTGGLHIEIFCPSRQGQILTGFELQRRIHLCRRFLANLRVIELSEVNLRLVGDVRIEHDFPALAIQWLDILYASYRGVLNWLGAPPAYRSGSLGIVP